MEERGIGPRPPRRPPAIAFLDLTGFTAVAEEQGDEAAADLAADLAKVVQQMTSAPGSGPVKWLGDGVMFYFSEPGEAIATSLDLVDAAERATALPARIGINAGPVVVQEGDYFGRTVNVAARIADFARPHEVLVSETARTSSGTDGVAFELVGDVPLRGVSRSVRLHRASRAA
jgi:class 3 adenylate cyclase